MPTVMANGIGLLSVFDDHTNQLVLSGASKDRRMEKGSGASKEHVGEAQRRETNCGEGV